MGDARIKLVLLGHTNVGKTALLHRFDQQEYKDHFPCTVGAAFLTKTVDVGKQTVKLEIWDTNGMERYRSLTPMYYRGASAALVVYDITEPKSFAVAKSWVTELRESLGDDVFIVFIGNKYDRAEQRQIRTRDGAEYADDHGLTFFETSAKSNRNVNEAFLAAASGAIVVEESQEEEPLEEGSDSGGCC
eukprot:gnl/Chilomastix_cuspidata/1620.p1 GENE.gnl/Chilomastix_cuspidata/1620~~gnl/Chilomastix_cuspidata/1620.p1  ORF type:complete len:189 (+),score=29.86 gnl/Chilomastix_cuspidata/1620:36-602(+)